MKESGIGRENGLEAFEACECYLISAFGSWSIDGLIRYVDSQSKSTIVNIASAEESRANDDWFADSGESKRYG